MFEITPSVEIDAPPDIVWDYLTDIEAWWVPSNPAHDSLEILSNGDLRKGSRIRVKESIAGIPGVAEGVVTEYRIPDRITWEAPNATYRYLGIELTVDEAVTWGVEPTDAGTELSANVWATFPDTLKGRLFEWSFKHVLNGVEKDYEHAMTELEYIKSELE